MEKIPPINEIIAGISRMSLWAIQKNPDVYVEAGQSGKTFKWAGFISCVDSNHRPRILLSSLAIFDNEDLALAKMKEVIDEVKKMPCELDYQT